jgi:uroporphyrinogen decarboxylase
MFVCGDATRNLEVMAKTTCHNVAIDEQIPLPKIRDIVLPMDKSFGGNLKLTVVLLMGEPEDAKLNAIDCIETAGEAGFILAPGCDLPYDVKPENLQAVAEMVHDTYQRDVARKTLQAREADTFEDIVVPDYGSEPGIIIDVITLDSGACAPCQYMFNAALEARAALEKDMPVKVVEHKITTRAGVGMMTRLGVANLPSICIDGKCRFSSIIPDTRTLAQAIRETAEQKQAGRG